MNKPVILTLALLSLAAAGCAREDTKSKARWRRVEPRLSGADVWKPCHTASLSKGQLIPEVRCGEQEDGIPPIATPAGCDDVIISTQDQAIWLLTATPHCADRAILKLESLAATNSAVWSDVAAAYYVRAQRNDWPADFVRAMDAADRAVSAAPQLPAAWFNLALAQEALGLTEEAIASWKEASNRDSSAWGKEALQRQGALQAKSASSAARQWSGIKQRLPVLLASGDVEAVGRLIDPFPFAAENYLQRELLPEWAASPSPERMARAKTLATALYRRNGDSFPVDVVTATESTKQPVALQLVPALARAISVSLDSPQRAIPLLDSIERKARQHRYAHFVARVQSTRAYFRSNQSKYLQSIAEYDVALGAFERLRDRESTAIIKVRRIGALRMLGAYEDAAREALEIHSIGTPLVEIRQRHLLDGEMAQVALALECPRAALHYQRAAVRDIQRDLADTPPENAPRIADLLLNLTIALRELAALAFDNGDFDRGRLYLNDARRLLTEHETDRSKAIQRELQERLRAVQGKGHQQSDPRVAVEAFGEALELSKGDTHSYRARLFAARAEAQRRRGYRKEAARDLREALKEVRAEEAEILRTRQRGKDDAFWISYFSMFQRTYQLLIQQLVEDGKTEEAFLFAEQSRTYEPVSLVLQSNIAPKAFRALTPEGDAIGMEQIRRHLPAGTFLLEYLVLPDRTYAWIVSHDAKDFLILPLGGAQVERWVADLQAAARTSAGKAFVAGLDAPYQGVLAEPMRHISAMPGGEKPRLVIIPDGALHGLPFAALYDRARDQYLIEKADVAIAGSAMLYLFALLRDGDLPATADPLPLLIGDPAFAPSPGYSRLAAARSEVDRIRRLYRRGIVLTDDQPTAEEVLRRAPDCDILHFAGHAVANRRAPEQSRLLLAKTPQHSGAITAQELVADLSLPRTRLVVLSACSSAGGLPVGPQGVGPLVRPFIASGVPGLVGSLWDVEDATAEALLVSFHRAYRDGLDATAAMRSAQLEILGRDRRNVLGWAAFEVIGQASSPSPSGR